jgi:hypothetical protein
MTFSLNRVVLSCIAEMDLFAVLALADTSSSLRQFIHDQVLTSSLLSRYLRENQYVLHHDAQYFRLIPSQQVAYLARAFKTLRSRNSETAKRVYDESVGGFGPLLCLIPFDTLRQSPLPDDLSIPDHDWNGRPQNQKYTIENAYWNYFHRLMKSWIHSPRYLYDAGETSLGFYDFHQKYAHKYLREDFLSCKRYIDDYNTCYRLLNPNGVCHTAKLRLSLLEFVANIRNSSCFSGLSLLLRKRCIQATADYWYLSPFRLDEQVTSAEEFQSLFESRGWLEMWDESELGWWYALGLWQYGPDSVETFIKRTFKDKRNSVIWMFLGAHQWFREKKPRKEEPDHIRRGLCCSWVMYDGRERDYITELVASVSKADRIWIMRQIIRRAPEYGVCRDLGANVFNYFVLHDLKEVDAMMCILLEEIIGSPLQYLFEYAISIAIAEYQNMEGVSPLVLDEARKFGAKLLRKSLDLYTLVGNVEIESLERGLFECSM